MKKTNLILGLAIIILAFGAYLLTPPRMVEVNNQSATQQHNQISYPGVEGKNALELLQVSHQVETTSYSYGQFVNSIDDQKPDSQHFWALYINGQKATLGADSYQTKNSDILSWQLEKIE